MATAVDFAIIKATGADDGMYVDQQYGANIAGARAHGMDRGTYHYPGGGNAAVEANFYVDHAGRVPGEVQMLDYEGVVLNGHDPVGWAKNFLDQVHGRTGNRPLLYMSDSVTHRFDWTPVVAGNYGLDDADWGSTEPTPSRWPFAAVWQNADNGHIPGIGPAVDLDVFNGDKDAWAAYAANDGEAPVLTTTVPAPLPAKPPAPLPTPPSTGTAYTVQPGNTLSGIAAAHGLTLGQLEALNPGAGHPAGNFNNIHAGDLLKLTGGPAPTPAAPAGHPTYVVQSGDNLTKIAARYPSPAITWQSIARANGIPAPYVVRVGQRLTIA